jgi:hypothetical protein
MIVKDHAVSAAVVCAGCGCALCRGQKFRTMHLVSIDRLLICHFNKKCLWAAAMSIERGFARYEAIIQARYLMTEEQRKKASES